MRTEKKVRRLHLALRICDIEIHPKILRTILRLSNLIESKDELTLKDVLTEQRELKTHEKKMKDEASNKTTEESS